MTDDKLDTAITTKNASSPATVTATMTTTTTMIQKYKEYGDMLYKLGDASLAISYYEYALSLSSPSLPQIGSTIIVKIDGHPKIAEVDCIDEQEQDDDLLDVTLVEDGTEMTIKSSKVLLCIYHEENKEEGGGQSSLLLLQERILLNLTRCLLQLVEYYYDNTSTNNDSIAIELGPPSHYHPEYKQKYLSSAVLSSTLALTVAAYNAGNGGDGGSNKDRRDGDDDTTLPPNGQMALYLRAKTQHMKRSMKYNKHATLDIKRLIRHLSKTTVPTTSQIPSSSKGKKNPKSLLLQSQRLLQDIEMKQRNQVKTDKKLAKAVCKLVESATATTNVTGTAAPSTKTKTLSSTSSTTGATTSGVSKRSNSSLLVSFPRLSFLMQYVLFPLIVAYFIQKYFQD